MLTVQEPVDQYDFWNTLYKYKEINNNNKSGFNTVILAINSYNEIYMNMSRIFNAL